LLDFGPRQLILGLLVSVAIGNSIIFFSESENRAVFSELVTIIAASSAVLLAAAIALRQDPAGPHGKSYLSLAIGLVLWLCADIVWASYELFYHIAAPIPSWSDVLWLSGYPFFAYNLFQTYKEFNSSSKRRVLLASIIGNAIFLAYLVTFTIGIADLSSPSGLILFAVLVSYPVANAVLTIPAFPLLLGLWRDKPWSIPWTFKALSLFCIVVTDSWFAFIVITGLQEQVWVASMLFGAEYLIMASGLVWYNKFLSRYSSHEPRAMQERVSHRGKRRPIDLVLTIVVVAAVLTYGAFSSTNTDAAELVPSGNGDATVTIGALLPLTGTLSSFGESSSAALRIAVSDVNEHFAATGSNTRVELVIEDTKTDPAIALQKIKKLDSQGVKVVIGPATSAAVASVIDYAKQNGILLVSTSSTAPQLAIPGDNLLRLVPQDSHQADVMAKKMWDDGVRVVIPMWRTDLYGEGLHSALKSRFTEMGGLVADGVGYKAPTGDFAASLHRINFIFWEQELRKLAASVNDAVSKNGADKVGVYLIAFDEVVPIMIQSERHPDLGLVRWYGSDGSAQNAGLVNNPDAAHFAITTSYVTPIYGVEENERFDEISLRVREEIGSTHRSYAEVGYDALWVISLAYDKAGEADFTILRDTIVQTANSYQGITGNIRLDDAGDRKVGLYDLWSVHHNGDNHYEWSKSQ
jgi:branched-chain amino acid transport system substrate-binding protein